MIKVITFSCSFTNTSKHFAMRKATSADQIYPVFRDLFKKEGAAQAA